MENEKQTTAIYDDAAGPLGITAEHKTETYGDGVYLLTSITIHQKLDGVEHREVFLTIDHLEAIVKAARAAERKARQEHANRDNRD